MRSLLLVTLLLFCQQAVAERMQTPYLTLDGKQGQFTQLRVDGNGRGQYGRNIIKSLELSGLQKMEPTAKGANWVEYGGAEPLVLLERTKLVADGPDPVHLEPGHTLGQSFTAERPFTYVGARIPTWLTGDSGGTFTLRQDGPGGKLIATQSFPSIQDNSWIGFSFDMQHPGKYYLEFSGAKKTPGWYSHSGNPYASGEAFADGKPIPGADRTLEINMVRPAKGTWRVSVDGNRLKSEFRSESSDDIRGLKLRISFPWIRDGYNCSDPAIIFSRFYAEGGRYLPIEQFKRTDSQEIWGKWIHGTGRNGADLQFMPGGNYASWELSRDTMTMLMDVNTEIEIQPQDSPLPGYYPQFFSSDPKLDSSVNSFFYERGHSWPDAHVSADWFPWIMAQHCWNHHPYREQIMASLRDYPLREDGYVNTWGNQTGWPFPDNTKYDTRHFYTNPNFILGCAMYYQWTGDEGFLSKMKDKLRKACNYMLDSPEVNGAEGLLRQTSKDHDGTSNTLAGNYWDDIPFGNLSAYENIYFYASLEAMASLERIWGDEKRAKELMALREKARNRYNETFWDEKAGRYIGCVDVNGVRHDYGFTFVNLEAAAMGLPEKRQVERIYNWLEKEPTATGKPDTYSAFIFAPRVNTIDNQKWWFLNGTFPGLGFQPFGTHCEQGGAILYVSYFDLMARRNYLGIDNAMKRFREILGRYEMPDKLCGGNPLYRGENDTWQVGASIPMPESGLVPCFYLYGILGLRATESRLEISPSLPSGMEYAGVKHLWYRGKPLTVRIQRDRVEVAREDNQKTWKRKLNGQPILLESTSSLLQ